MNKNNSHIRAYNLSLVTVGYNFLEGVVSILFGVIAGSYALIGFGLDSFVETFSGGIMVWRFKHSETLSSEENEKKERRAIILVAYSFYIFGGYVIVEALKNLYFGNHPEQSIPGIIIAIVSLITMPILFLLKSSTAKQIGSKSFAADSKQTLACMMLSFFLLVGLGFNYLWQIWWADSMAGVFIGSYLLYEGYKTYKEKDVCNC